MMAELRGDEAEPDAARGWHWRGNGVMTVGIVLGVLTVAAVATWYGIVRAQSALRSRAPHRLAPSDFPVPHDRSGWGRAG
jgi:hypothetical protein